MHVGFELNEGLHRAFAVRRGIAHNEGAAVILQCPRHDFRSRGAEPAGQHNQRPIIKHCRVAVFILDHVAFGVFHLNDRPFLDEQTGEIDGFLEGTAAIMAQIQNHTGDLFCLQFFEQPGHVFGRALVRGPAWPLATSKLA